MTDQENDDARTAARCGVLVDNQLGRYQLRWLIEQAGEHGVQDAVLLLAGLRRPYTTNIAQVLGLSMPKLLPSTRSLGEMRADMLADADRQRASNLARAERNQRALEAETKAATMVQAQAIAALKEKLRLNGKLPSVPSEKPPEA